MDETFLTKSTPENRGQPIEPKDGNRGDQGCAAYSSCLRRFRIQPAPLMSTDTRPPLNGRTVSASGIGPHEVDRFQAAARAMATADGLASWAVTIRGTGAEPREVVDEWLRQLGQEVRRAGCPRYWCLAWHGDPEPHAHGLVCLPTGKGRAILTRVCARPRFKNGGPETGSCVDWRPVNDLDGWCRYCLAERTPQANFGDRRGWRRAGSHPLDGGGDRVRLSPDLRRDAIAGGWVRPWAATNAKRAPAVPRPCRRASVPKPAPRLGLALTPMQLSLFRDDPPSRLRDYAGGPVPRTVALECEWRRKRLGLSHTAIGREVGLSRAQYGNAMRGAFGLSRKAANRLRDFLLTAA